jgi:aspartate aminotransferase
MQLSERIRNVKPSPTLSLDAKAKALKAQGVDLVSFGAGEPDFNTPRHIKAAGIKAIEDNFTRYTPAGGTLELKQAVISKFQKDNGLTYAPEEIVINCGGKHSLYNMAQVLFQEGDEVIIPAPYWVSYPPIVSLAGAKPVIVKTLEAHDFKLTPDDLKNAVTPHTKALILNSPSNPTGSVYSREELEALGQVILEHDLVVISDDIYEKLIFNGRKFFNTAMLNIELKQRTIIAHGLAKTYAMTGWRIGFIAAPKDVASAVTRLQSQSTSNPCSIAQMAGVAALNGPQDEVDEMVKSFDERRTCLVQALRKINGVECFMPGGAFYVFPNLSFYYGRKTPDGRILQGSSDLADYLLENARVACVPGSAFGEDDCLRLSYAISLDDIEKGVTRLEKALAILKP